MSTAYECAFLNLRLFELRREPVLREARQWFLRDFDPESFDELVTVLSGERNASFRMVLGYWDMAASLVTTGAIDADSFVTAHGEIFLTFSKIHPHLARLREASGEVAFCKHLEAVVLAVPDAAAIMTRRHDAVRHASRSRSAAPKKTAGSTDGLLILLVRELAAFQREIEMFPDDDSVWRTVPGVTNSAGNLALHVCGNLQHFVGQVFGHTSFVRNRDVEFGQKSGGRARLVDEIQATIHVVEAILPTVTQEALAQDYPEQVGGHTLNTGLFLLHLSAHLAHHLGQAGYLRRILTMDNRSSGPLPLTPLALQRF